jgi:hypothetical protein
MKHTKGKWIIGRDDIYDSTIKIIAQSPECERLVAKVVITENEDRIRTMEGENNAKLIAKAPEMYEALKRVINGKKCGDIQYVRETGKIIHSLLKEIES